MTSSSEHPIQTARREWLDGYREYLGRTHYLMADLREQAERRDPVPETDEPVDYEVATEDLTDLGTAPLVETDHTLTDAEYRALEFGDEGGMLV